MFWSTAKAIPSALLPFEQTPISFRKCFFMEKEPRAKNKLGQTRNSRNRSSSRTIKHRKKSECVSLFKRQIHDFPFSSALFTQCVVHFFDDDTFGFAVSACWKKSSDRVWRSSDLWLNCISLFHTHSPLHRWRKKKIAAQMITVDQNLCAKLEIRSGMFKCFSSAVNKHLVKVFYVGCARTIPSVIEMQFSKPWFWNILERPPP